MIDRIALHPIRVAGSAPWIGLLLIGSIALAGCAPVALPEPDLPSLSDDPFATWVGNLEAGRTNIEDIVARFGPPDDLEERLRGGTIWRYSHAEVEWSKYDPRRPVVSADGEVRPAGRNIFQHTAHFWNKLWGWKHQTFSYPPLQPRPARKDKLPATIHRLEIVFAVDGTVERFRYLSEPGFAQVDPLL